MTSMAPQINFDSVGAQPLFGVSYDPEARAFSLRAGVDGGYLCSISYGFQGFDHIEDALVDLFTHSIHAESDVRPVIMNNADKTVGWLCTISALTSDQHNYAESPYFRRAAFTAIHLLFQNGLYTKEPNVRNEDGLKISDFFDETLSVLILHKPSIGVSVSNDLTEILPNLHQYGFVPVGTQSTPRVQVCKISSDYFSNIGSKLRLYPVSTDVGFAEFTNQFFRQLLPSAPTPLLRFFLYYQLIETLLARIFNDRQSETITKLVDVKDNPVKAHPLIEKLKADASEKKRMALLFNEYSGIEAKMNGLLGACNIFLDQSGAGKKNSVAEALYDVRNNIFHDLRGVPTNALPFLKEIVEELGYAVPELMINFHTPGVK